MQLLTNSRMSTMKTCLRKHYLSYELGLTRKTESQPLRMGSAVHAGLESRADGDDLDTMMAKIDGIYEKIPDMTDPIDWELEREIVRRLLFGYCCIYDGEKIEVVKNEFSFRLPIVNPSTGRSSKNFELAGKIDRIIRLADGRLAILETKTTSEDLSDGSDYWPRLRLDQQISLYVVAARSMGYDVETVIYDCIRKPGIRPKLVKGTRETPGEFGGRLTDDIQERPDFYFRRKEIPRLESDLDEFKKELWIQSKLMRVSQVNGYWPRNSNACTMPYRCPMTDICFSGIDAAHNVPSGYVKKGTMHPELGDMENDYSNRTAANAAQSGSAVSTATESINTQ